MEFKSQTTILRIFDEAQARSFYLDYLGFEVDWEHRFGPELPIYMQVSRGDCRFHLSEHHGDGTPGSKLRVECVDIAAIHQDLKSKNYKRLNPGLEKKPWGTLEIELKDPFGNSIILYEAVAESGD